MDDGQTTLPPEIETEPAQRVRLSLRWWILFGVIDLCLLAAAAVFFISRAPADFRPVTLTVESGQTVRETVDQLADQNIVRSSALLYLLMQTKYKDVPLKAGRYEFPIPLNAFAVANYLAITIPSDELVSLTFPEGMRARDYATIAAATLSDFNTDVFIRLAEPREGYLWPETYFVRPDFSEADLLALFEDNFVQNTADLEVAITNHPLSEYEILILASIIEREANDVDSMRTVAGILQNRLSINMALQADATIEYTLDKPLDELTPADLKIDSPYNTYTRVGLPPTPIGNPGRMAIEAVLDPIVSENLFYITGTDGTFYYAKTYDEHRLNIARYLR